MKVKLKNVRLSFPSLWQHSEFNGESSGRYEATLLIHNDDPQLAELKKVVASIGKDKFGDTWKKAKMCLRDGSDRDYAGYEDSWSLKATNKRRPAILDRDTTPLTQDDGYPLAGDYVNVSVSIWAFSNDYGKYIACQLLGMQFVKKGERFSSRDEDATDDFDVIEEEETEEAPF